MGIGMNLFVSWMLLLALALYLVPTIIAFKKDKQNKVAISALNVLLGWTFLVWVVALVWALTED